MLDHKNPKPIPARAALYAVRIALSTALALGGCQAVSHAAGPYNCQPETPATVDDFSGPAGTPPNPQLWSYFLGAGGTDGQLEAYTNSPRNASLDGNGNLAIVAYNEPFTYPGYSTVNYTSAMLQTIGRLDFCYGSVSARIKLPAGQGLRPAFWLLGSDIETVGWPQCGEIDIMEQPNGGSTLHGPGGYELPVLTPYNVGTGWHVYGVDWRRDKISTTIDGSVLASWTPASLPPGAPWVFNDHRMYIILNMAIGGPGGPPDAATQFPATMLVDWVRYTPAPNG